MAGSFLPPAIFEIKAIADQAIAKFEDVNKELGKMEEKATDAGGKVDNIGKASRMATAGIMAAGAAFVGMAAIGIKEAIETENAFNKLGSTMSAVGVNTAANRAKVKELTDSYVDLGFGGDQAAVAFEKLLRVNGSVDDSQKLLALSADLARTKNIGLSDAAGILAKASMGNAKAFKEMGIELDNTLPKNEAIAKAMDELNAKIGDQAENATKTFAVQLQIVKERFNDTAESLGSVLLPMLKSLLEKLNSAIEFVKRNSNAFQILGGIILTIAVSLASYNAAIKVQMALTKAWTVVTTLQTMATNLLKGQQLALNTAMKMNPIGLVVAAAMLLIGALVLLWNKSETFRKVVIQVGKTGLNAFAAIIPIVANVYEVILKVVTGPLRGLLGALSHLPGVGKYAKAGLDLINKGLDGVSDFGKKAAEKVKTLSDGLDKLNKPIKIGGGGLEIPDLGNTEVVENVKKLDAKAKAELQKSNEEALKLIKDTQEKMADAQQKYAEKTTAIQKDYTEKVNKLQSDAAEKIVEIEKDAADKRIKLNKDAADKIADLENDAAKKIADIEKKGKTERLGFTEKFNQQVADLTKKHTESLANLEQENQNKLAEITQNGADKLRVIVTESVDRLRSAFAKGTEFALGETFKQLVEGGKASAEELVNVMKDRLAGIKKLAENASALAGAGFSQTFIEQVVSQGPEVGNQLAQTILDATPETRAEMMSLYGAIESTSNTGLDSLAKQMNSGARLATAELTQAYADAQRDTAEALKRQGEDYLKAQAEINSQFNTALAEAEKTRDDAIAESLKAQEDAIADVKSNLTEATAAIQKELAESLAEVDKTLQEQITSINKDLNSALADSHKEMSDAMEEARATLSDSLAKIQKEYNDKMAEIDQVTAKVATKLAAFSKQLADARADAANPIVIAPPITVDTGGTGAGSTSTTAGTTAIVTTPAPEGAVYGPTAGTGGTAPLAAMSGYGTTINNVSITGVNLANPTETTGQVINGIKYGSVVMVSSAAMSGYGTAKVNTSSGGASRTVNVT